MLTQLGRHLIERGEQIGERARPSIKNRVGLVDRVEGDLAGVGVDHRLHRVADVIRAAIETGAAAQLHVPDALRVGVIRGSRVGVDHPHHPAIDRNRIRIAVVVEERSELLDALLHIAHQQQLRIRVDRPRAQDVVIEEGERGDRTPNRATHLDPRPTRIRLTVTAGTLRHIGVRHRVARQRRREIELGPIHLKGAVVRTQRRRHPTHRSHHQTTAARRHEMLALPGLVRDASEIELARRDQHLLALPVDHVAVDVEVIDLQPGHLAAVDREPRQQQTRGEQTNVLDRFEIALHLGGGERGELDLAGLDRIETHRGPRRDHVALDVRSLTLLLVGADHQRLNHRRVNHAANDRHHQPERRGEQRQPPPVGADRRQIEQPGEHSDQGEQHERGKLGVDDRVGGTLHEPSRLVGESEPAQPVIASLQQGKQPEQRSRVHLRGAPHRRDVPGDHHSAVQQVRQQREQQHHDRRRVQPVESERQERQLEHVEPDISTELRVVDAEVARVPKQQPVLPLLGGWQREHQSEEHGGAVADETQATPEHLVESLDVGMHIRWEHARREPIGEPQVDERERDEEGEEDSEQRQLRNQLSPKDVGATEAVMPEVIEVEAGDAAAEHHHQEENRAERDESDTTTRAAARRWSREV